MSWKFNPFTGNLDFDATDHAAVTIGAPANGLSLVGQVLSLGLASAGVTGALSGTDWSTFNAKQAALTLPLGADLGGTGIANAAGSTLTLGAATSITGGGTVALGGFTATIPASLTVAGLAIANVFTDIQTIKGTAATDYPTYGAEFLLDTGWTSVDWTGDWATGWKHTTGNTTVLSQSKAAVVGVKYQITCTVTERSAGSYIVAFGGQTAASATSSSTFGPTATAVTNLTITPTSTFDGKIVISIKSITAVSSALEVFQTSDGTAALEIRVNPAGTNVGIGINALQYNTPGGITNLALGGNALQYNTTGVRNTALGSLALQQNTTGFRNTGIGEGALQVNTTGRDNTGIGVSVLRANTTGYANMAIGTYAMQFNQTGYSNVAIGNNALNLNISGEGNMSIGDVALQANTSGHYNIGIGQSSLLANQTGGHNIGIGHNAGRTILNVDNNVFIGENAGYHASQLATAANSIAIGADTYTTLSNTIVLGNASIVGLGIGTFAPAALLHPVARTTTTNAIKEVGRLEAIVSTAVTGAAAGFGVSQTLWAETATDLTNKQQGRLWSKWIVPTNGSETAAVGLDAYYNSTAREFISGEATTTAVMLAFFGGTRAIQQVLAAYTSDGEGAAYTGIDNLQAGTVYATVADLNQLRVAYETLRASYDDLRTKLQTSTLVA